MSRLRALATRKPEATLFARYLSFVYFIAFSAAYAAGFVYIELNATIYRSLYSKVSGLLPKHDRGFYHFAP